MNDLRFALRQLRKSPGFTSVAVLTLALGIGANSAIFSVVNAVLFDPLGFKQPERLVTVWETNKQPGVPANLRNEVARGNFYDWRAQNQVFENIAALTYASLNLTGVDQPERVQGAAVTFNFFNVLGVGPAIGRSFRSDEETAGAARVAVISHGFWQRSFGGDPNLVGTARTFNGEAFTIAGIMPAGFEIQFPAAMRVDLWTPLRRGETDNDRVAHFLYALARLKEGVSLEQAQAAMDVIANRLSQQYPDTNSAAGVNLIPLRQQLVGDVQPYLYLLFGAVGFVLLIACANVANLILARLAGRRKEMAVRQALGAGRGRLIRQLLTESLLLSTLGGTLGFVFAFWGVDLLRNMAPADLPRLSEIGLNASVFWWTLGILLLTSVLSGLAPAVQAASPDLNSPLQESGRTTGGATRGRISRLLVVSEIALALLLLVGAGLMIRSSIRLQQVNPGFESEKLLTLNIALPQQKYPESAAANVFFENLLARITALPGVVSVGGIDPLPMSGSDSTTSILIEGQPIVPQAERAAAGERFVTPAYFDAMKIPLLEGRAFTAQDRAETPPVIVVNEAFAQRFFPGERALGKRVGLEDENSLRWAEIVGVVGNVKHRTLDAEIKPELFEAYLQSPRRFMTVVVRTQFEPASLIGPIREQVLALDKDQPVFEIRTMSQRLAESAARSRFVMLVLGVFAGVALVLAAIGIYGVLAYFVSHRRREIGIRMALGAGRGHVLRLIVGEGVLLAAAGLAIGLLFSFGLNQLIANLLYDVSPTDPATLAGVSLLLVTVALLACVLPARRAAGIDPMACLRSE